MSIQAVIISININGRSSAHIIVMFLAAGETLKAARCVYAAAVRADVPTLCFNHQHRLHQQLNAEKCSKAAREGQYRLSAALYLTPPRRRLAVAALLFRLFPDSFQIMAEREPTMASV